MGQIIIRRHLHELMNNSKYTLLSFDRLNQPPAEEEEFERQQHEKLIGQLKYVDVH